MNNGRMWCVVNPTIGIPLFLGGVVVASLSVHTAILTNTTWFADFLAGRTMGATAQIDTKAVSPVALKTQDGKAAYAVSLTRSTGDSSTYVTKVDRLPGNLALASSTTTVK